MEAELWRASQQSRCLGNRRSRLSGLWRDSASKEVDQRYLTPHASADSEMLQDLTDEKTSIEASETAVVAVESAGQGAAEQVEASTRFRHQATEDIRVGYDFVGLSESERQAAQDEATAASAALRSADASCSGIGGPHESGSRPVAFSGRAPQSNDVMLHLIANVNPGGPNSPGRSENCVECAIATDATLAGTPTTAPPGAAQSVGAIENRMGGSFVPVSGEGEIRAVLDAAGPGARGIVFADPGNGDIGHVFNGVNSGGSVLFLDGQTGGWGSFEGYTSFHFLRTN